MTTTIADRDAFSGTWRRRGLIHVPVIAEPEPVEPQFIIKAEPEPPKPTTWHVTGVLCDDCGCLLTHADELCPACVRPWMYAQEKAHNERRPVIYYRCKEAVAA